MNQDELRDKDWVVLQQIQDGNDDVQRITSETTLENHHVTYSLQKLEELGLVEVTKPEGMVERVINGQKQVFQHPKQAELTDKGEQYLENSQREGLDEYENLSHEELVETVHQLENRVEELEQKFELFRKQVKKEI